MKKPLEYYLNAEYPFIVRPDLDDGGFIIEFTDLEFCVGSGDTVEEALKDAMVAKAGWLQVSYENGNEIPEPLSNEDYNGRITLRVPKSLHRRIIEKAKNEGVSANQYMLHLISAGIGIQNKYMDK